MSIQGITNKIKGNSTLDKRAIMYLFIVVGVGVGAFGLGRLSIGDLNIASDNVTVVDDSTPSQGASAGTITTSIPIPSSAQGNYVASKNGKLYYPVDCASAKRIALKNRMWFATSEDAEKSGFTPSSSCK